MSRAAFVKWATAQRDYFLFSPRAELLLELELALAEAVSGGPRAPASGSRPVAGTLDVTPCALMTILFGGRAGGLIVGAVEDNADAEDVEDSELGARGMRASGSI